MKVADVIRQQTLAIRDALSSLDQRLEQAEAQSSAADERVKRASTEITRQRALESERKRSLNSISKKKEEKQRILDELDRKRQEALDELDRYREEHNSIAQSLREAQRATEIASTEIVREQKAKQDAESSIAKIRDDRAEKEKELRSMVLKALDMYLDQQAANIQAAFSSHAQRAKGRRAFEEFKKARHTDPEIAKLCDERDELHKLFTEAMVPGVKDKLRAVLKPIEDEIDRRFPGALHLPEAAPPNDSQIEELLYFCNREGKAIFLLPISITDWSAAETQAFTDRTSNAMCLVWNMVRELKLKTGDGAFTTVRGRAVFASRFDLEDVAILEGFSVKGQDSVVLHFILSSIPTELQEALSHEN
jgi:hypothetical protein